MPYSLCIFYKKVFIFNFKESRRSLRSILFIRHKFTDFQHFCSMDFPQLHLYTENGCLAICKTLYSNSDHIYIYHLRHSLHLPFPCRNKEQEHGVQCAVPY